MAIFDWFKSKSIVNPEVTKLTEELASAKADIQMYEGYRINDPVLIAQSLAIKEALKSGNGRRDMITDFHVAAAYGAVYMKVAETRKKLIREVDKMRVFYMVDVILTQLVEDALAPQIGTGDVLSISSDRPELQKEIDYLEEKFDLDQVAMILAPDICAYGEYTLKTVINPHPDVIAAKEREEQENESFNELTPGGGGPSPTGTNPNYAPYSGQDPSRPQIQKNLEQPQIDPNEEYGLIDLLDNLDQGSVVGLTKWNTPEGYLIGDAGSGKNPGNIKRAEPADFVKFSLNSARVKVDIFKEFNIKKEHLPKELKEIPKFIRVGKSMIYGIVSKLKELELLEALVPATKLSKLSNGTLVGVQVPPGYDIEKAIEATKQIEGLMNKKVGVDPILEEITIENIMGTAGRLKAVPIFGDTGRLQKLDYKQDEPDDLLASVTDIRKVICASIGIPYELLFEGESAKGEILKKYARYLRKLKAIQKTIEEGIRQIVYIHLANKGYKFDTQDIKVEFYNKLIEIDNLDKLEFIDTTVGLIRNVKDFVMEMADRTQHPAIADQVDVVGFMRWMNEQLNVVGFNNLFMQMDNTAPGNPVAVPTNIPGVNKSIVPNIPPIEPKIHKDNNPLATRVAQDKPKRYISTQKEESVTNSRYRGVLANYIKRDK
jgi:hypothetical protein